MTQIKLQDESGDKKYFTQLPSIILNHSTAIDQALYWQMKRYAGEDGQCFATQETLMKKLKIGRITYNKSLNYLLKKRWVKYDGMTQGKTRPIKTYSIVDIWKENIMEYEEIPSETAVSFNQEIPSETTGDTVQNSSKIPSERAVEEEPYKEEPLRRTTETKVSGKKINDLIELFKSVNPSYKQLFKRKNQREAIQRLLKELGQEKLEAAIKYAEVSNQMPYAPTITTPLQLENKIGVLRAFVQKEIVKKSKNNIAIL